MLESMSREQVENFQYEIRKYLLAKGVQQVNGFRFEYVNKNRNGTMTTTRYDLLKRAMTVHKLHVDWKRKGKYGNPDPYRWIITSVGFYRDIVISKTEHPELNESSGLYEFKTEYKSLYYPNALEPTK